MNLQDIGQTSIKEAQCGATTVQLEPSRMISHDDALVFSRIYDSSV
jgi:hypothetical protein